MAGGVQRERRARRGLRPRFSQRARISIGREWLRHYRAFLPACVQVLAGVSGDRPRLATAAAIELAGRAILAFVKTGGYPMKGRSLEAITQRLEKQR